MTTTTSKEHLDFILTCRRYWDVLKPGLKRRIGLSTLKKSLDKFNH